MKDGQENINEILNRHVPRVSDEQADAVGERVLYRLHHSTPSAQVERLFEPTVPQRTVIRWWPALIAAVAGILVLVGARVFFRTPSSAVWVDNTPVQTLSDGSRLEIRSGSKWQLETASDGLRIHLNHGSIIVTAARQRNGHLYVRTRDLTVSVVGTIFMVHAGELRSTVHVIEGKVQVRRSEDEVSLLPGEEVSSSPFVKKRINLEVLSWSRNAPSYIAMLSQTPSAPATEVKPKRTFEVTSIRPNTSGINSGGLRVVGDRLQGTGASLRRLLWYAYQPGDAQFLGTQILNMPGWGDVDRFDVDAKIGGEATSVPQEQIREMVRSMLEERFRLKAHRAIRELPVYNLVLIKGGPKLSADQTPPPEKQRYTYFGTEDQMLPRGAVRMFESPYRSAFVGQSIDIATFMSLIQGRADRIVLDKTNFTGLFDIDIQISKDAGPLPPPDTPIPTIFGALQEINLKLEAGKANLPVLIVDSVQRPTPN